MSAQLTRFAILAAILTILPGCGMIPFKASTNTPCPPGQACKSGAPAPQDPPAQASFELRSSRMVMTKDGAIDCSPKQHKHVLVLLALSGGGSRAALLSGLTMTQMQNIKLKDGGDLLSEVDLISSVSGGSLPAAYYASSGEPAGSNVKEACRRSYSGREWSAATVSELMGNDYRDRWIGNWFWPDNILLYWFTTYDRTDMMAQTLADNLFDTHLVGEDLLFRHLNPARPNLVLNATQGSNNTDTLGSFGQPFTFTQEDFRRIGSSIDDYELARGVMASATFPGVFNFMTLRNFNSTDTQNKEYMHVFDGGNSDNLGLTSIKRTIWRAHESGKLADYDKIVVILVDAYTDSSGASYRRNDPRHWYDYIVDTNFVTATDSLLAKNRDSLVNDFQTTHIFPYETPDLPRSTEPALAAKKEDAVTNACKKFFSWETQEVAVNHCINTDWNDVNNTIGGKLVFQHVQFRDVEDPFLQNQLNNIATDFKLADDPDPQTQLTDKEAINCAVSVLVRKDESNAKCKQYSMPPDVRAGWDTVRRAIEESRK